ncbi:ATP-dependent DNA helicase RecG [Nesterenkonia sp. MY13]|uniref:ATP-dependent DNA helicase RecG n=1 Tax=Nesterenkonia sedimenti TaxID=1463632 RepID=A0A7X8THJ7_9MICC|nr:ATP-dependent DNA helicase RecG [Nesterenkonia sedimenti]NLS08535.1 ATP-dependent DNA helicase RecG [Nesterenkonia sedimenti]
MSGPIFEDSPLESALPHGQAATVRAQMGYETVGELMRHFPRRYLAPGQRSRIIDLREGEVVNFVADVVKSSKRSLHSRKGFVIDVTVADDDGEHLELSFFYGWQAEKDLRPGAMAFFHGKVSRYRDRLTITNPIFDLLVRADGKMINPWTDDIMVATSLPIPLYPGTAKLSGGKIRDYIQSVFQKIDFSAWTDVIPQHIRDVESMPGLHDAYLRVHRPVDLDDQESGWRRFRFEEALILQGAISRRRQQTAAAQGIPTPPREDGVLAEFDQSLPFTLTEGQVRCGEWISADLQREQPMNRLLQGEVGSGKTLVALRAMLQVADSGAQAALIAPTEVLAVQHFHSLRRMLGDLAQDDLFATREDGPRIKITLLTGSMKTAARKQALLDIVSGDAGIVVGTHALLGEKVSFAQLGLVVVDEQHRFGVDQRNALRERYDPTPHMLVMSATPIPRSVAMTVFGDLELTVLQGLPGGRSPIQTHVVPMLRGPEWIGRVWQRVAEQVKAGHQVYVACPEISRDETSMDASVELITERLRSNELLADMRIGSAHGQQPAEDIAATMRAFEAGDLDILVATTIIEVGVDVPNATTMVILDAESFGISTLHQLRGRIGRGYTETNLCFLVTRMPEDHSSVQRLYDVARHTDGMHLARLDLQRRREGDVLGASQSGSSQRLKLLRVIEHEDLISLAAAHIDTLNQQDPEWKYARELHQAVLAWDEDHHDASGYADQG